MDNKQAIEILKDVVMEHNPWNSGISFWDLDSAIHKAIASLEAWDKVIEELRNTDNDREQDFYENTVEAYCEGWNTVVDIINKHLG